MIVANATELIRNSKKFFDLITKEQETVIIHRQRGNDIVIISLNKWNEYNEAVSPSLNIPYNKETQEAIQEALRGKAEVINNPSEFFKNL